MRGGGRARAGDDDAVALGVEVAQVGARLVGGAGEPDVGGDVAQARVDERAPVARRGGVDDDRGPGRGAAGGRVGRRSDRYGAGGEEGADEESEYRHTY